MLSLSLTHTFGIPSEENKSEKDHNFFGSRNVSLKNDKSMRMLRVLASLTGYVVLWVRCSTPVLGRSVHGNRQQVNKKASSLTCLYCISIHYFNSCDGEGVGLYSCPIGDDLYITERETNFFSPRNVDC